MSYLHSLLLFIFIAVCVSPTSAWADGTCMISPTQSKRVTSRFGIFREGGDKNKGSGNEQPHMHDGYDFGDHGASVPLFATTAGVVTHKQLMGSAGNILIIKRDNGERAVYYHLSSYDPNIKKGAKVTAGQQIGWSGATGMKKKTVHLHFVYGVPNTSQVRAKKFYENAGRNTALNPAQLPTVISDSKIHQFGYATDPAPYFCEAFVIDDGRGSWLGRTTKEQYEKIFGSMPPGGVPPKATFSPPQVAAANTVALDIQANAPTNTPVAEFLADGAGYGALPSPPIGEYESMSPNAMMHTEAMRRFADAAWATDIPKVTSRALMLDYLRAQAVSVYISEAIRRKKERVEALMALYTAQKMSRQRAYTWSAQQKAAHDAASRAIQ